jgi:hypothetical protein
VQISLNYPRELKGLAWHVFTFHALGVSFYLNTGKTVGAATHALCIQTNPRHPILISSGLAQTFKRITNQHIMTATKTQAYLKAKARYDKEGE